MVITIKFLTLHIINTHISFFERRRKNIDIMNKEAEGSNVRNMVEWLLTSEGQKAMSNAGYVPVKATK